MKGLIKYALVAVLATEAAAGSHRHHHRHIRRANVPAVKEAQANSEVKIIYQEVVKDEQGNSRIRPMDAAEAQRCLEDKSCSPVGETVSESLAPPPPPPPPSTPSPTTAKVEPTYAVPEPSQPPSSSSSHTASPPPPPLAPTSDFPPPPPSQSAPPQPAPPKSASHSAPVPAPSVLPSSPGNDCGVQGVKEDLEREFPSGELSCSQFPDGYGPIQLPWLKNKGWSGIQNVPDYQPGSKKDIVQIRTAPPEEGCTKNSMCSYACPPGWQKSQWPAEQGSKGESIGGLFCDSNGKLQLTRPSSKTLCERGVGGILAENKLDRNVTLCRTDYPGIEIMGLPTVVCPGKVVEVTNPKQAEFMWRGGKTSAHYYLNPAGVDKENACVWDNPNPELKDRTGDKAPVVLGAGYDEDIKTTFLSVASNNERSAIDYKIVIKDGSRKRSPLCEYEEPDPKAGKPCTVSVNVPGPLPTWIPILMTLQVSVAEGKEAIFSFE